MLYLDNHKISKSMEHKYSFAAFIGGLSAFWVSFKIFFAQASTFFTIGEGFRAFLIKLFVTVSLSFAGGVIGMLSKDIYTSKIQPVVQRFLGKAKKKREN